LSVETRFLDLVWEFVWYSRRGAARGGRTTFLEREIARLSQQLFGKPLNPWASEKFIESLHEPTELAATGFPGRPRKLRHPHNEDLYLYLTSQKVFERGAQIEWIEVESDLEALQDIQAELRREVGSLGLAVEINPSSNLLIADLADLEHHPFWRLRPPRPSKEDLFPVSVCIGSDDPITFASDLRQEYQLVFDTLRLSGLSDEETRQWIDRTRETGIERRFTLPRGTWTTKQFENRWRNELLTKLPLP
jgi:hypothetical protein